MFEVPQLVSGGIRVTLEFLLLVTLSWHLSRCYVGRLVLLP
jgi:hypothetical protein